MPRRKDAKAIFAYSVLVTYPKRAPVGLALYGRLNRRKSVGSPEAVPLRWAPPTSGIVNIQMII
eukprot:3081085-Pleurochrysis_carterae.AAC.2